MRVIISDFVSLDCVGQAPGGPEEDTVLAVYLWAVLSGRPGDVVRSVTFAALVFGNLALIVVNRSWRLPAWRSFRQRKNPALTWILAAATTLLIVLLTVPALRHAFSFGAMTPLDWLVALAAGLIGVAWFEAYKTRAHQ